MENAMNTDNFSLLIPKDTVKFVVSSISDLDKAREICIQYKVAEHCPIFKSGIWKNWTKRNCWIYDRTPLEWSPSPAPDAQVYLAAGTARSIKGGKNMAIDKDAIREHVRGILAALGDDLTVKDWKKHLTV